MNIEMMDIIDILDEDIYSSVGTEDALENGEISAEEAGFMIGYNQDEK